MTGGVDPAVLSALGADRAQTIETHGAVVILDGDSAFKIKKPVDLGFFDFTTPARRQAALQAELDLNRAAAPQIYRRLAWLTREETGLVLDGEGERVEPVLVMARFDQDALYSRLAQDDRLDVVEARALASMARRSHARAGRSRETDGAGRVRRVLDPLVERLAAAGAPRARVDALANNLRTAIDRHASLLDSRARAGFVRRCHGDLHLNNIVRLNGRPVPFDALEFDEELATIDVLYDLAFVLADLARNGLRAEACALTGQYLAGEDEALGAAGAALLDPFCALRAGVRALTSYKRDGAQSAEAAQWLALAEDFARPRPPRLIAVGGLSGSGKSTLADGLALALGGPAGLWVIKSDVERKAALGLDWSDKIPPEAYTPEAARTVYERQRMKAKSALAAGASVILDAVHLRAAERDAATRLAEESGAAFTGVWLDAERKVLEDRVAARVNDPSDADLAIVEKQSSWDPGAVAWPRLAAGAGRDAVLQSALELVNA